MRLLLRATFLLCGLFAFVHDAHASLLSAMQDQIVWSQPGVQTNHTIRFGAMNPIPAGGSIVLYQEDGSLVIPVTMDHTDMDFAVGPSFSGPFTDRTLAASANAASDGVSVTTGSAPGVSRIVITLNSTTGIAAGEFVQIEIGSNATFGGTGDDILTNPSTQGSYRISIETRDAGSVPIDYGSILYAVIAPVQMGPADTSDVIPPLRSNGLPSGTLPASTARVEFSINTDKLAFCHYDTASGTPYESMPNVFAKTLNTLHRQVVTVSQGSSYAYYVRCGGAALGSATNTDDYLISFTIGLTGSSSATTSSPTPPPPPTSSGGGSGIGGGNYLGKADVTFIGSSFPIGRMTLLKDSVVEFEFSTDVTGEFSILRYGYERGPQSFSIYGQDAKGRKTSTYTGTEYLIANTNNLIGPLYLSPTIAVVNDSVDPGSPVVVEGFASPGYEIEVLMEKQGPSGDVGSVRATTSADVTGAWSAELSTTGLTVGTYQVKARTIVDENNRSIFSPLAYVGVGEKASPDFALRADLNRDKKVNLVDFSILLFNWKTADAIADINQDGEVNLTDFSIMVFYWTG